MQAIARLRNLPTSTRKMRYTINTIRGVNVEKALAILKHSPQHAAKNIEKLLLSAINNWQQVNEGRRVEDSELYVKTVFADQGRTLKRFLPAPQGRAYRLRKRSNHVTLIVDSRMDNLPDGSQVGKTEEVAQEVAEQPQAEAQATTAEKKTAKPKKTVAKKTTEKKSTKKK